MGRADYNFNDKVTFGARVFFAPDFNQSGKTATFVAGGVKIPLPHDFSVYGGVGYQFFEDPEAFEQLAWTVGASYDWKALTFDLRYWDTDLDDDECLARSGFSDGCDARIVGTISSTPTTLVAFLVDANAPISRKGTVGDSPKIPPVIVYRTLNKWDQLRRSWRRFMIRSGSSE